MKKRGTCNCYNLCDNTLLLLVVVIPCLYIFLVKLLHGCAMESHPILVSINCMIFFVVP